MAKEEAVIQGDDLRLGQQGLATGSQTYSESNAWVRRTNWPTIYPAAHRRLLLEISRPPDRRYGPQGDERKLSYLMDAVDDMFDRCEWTAQHTSRFILCWLRSFDRDQCGRKPFQLVAKAASTARYRRIWKRCIAFAVRRWLLGQGQDPIPGLPNPGSQLLWRRLLELWGHEAWAMLDASLGMWPRGRGAWGGQGGPVSRGGSEGVESEVREECSTRAIDDEATRPGPAYQGISDPREQGQAIHQGDDDGDDDEDDDEDEDDGEGDSEDWDVERWDNDSEYEGQDTQSNHGIDTPEPRQASQLRKALEEVLELLFQLSVTICTEQYTDGQPSSTLLVYFSGVLGLNVDATGFQRAKQYTPTLSGLIYVQRLLFLEYALPLRAYQHIGLPQRTRLQQQQQLDEVRRKYMVVGAESPFDELRALRNYGKVVGRDDPPSVFLRWSDDLETVSYGDTFSITMTQFRGLADLFVMRAETIVDRLMLGLEPEVSLSSVSDDLTNERPGFSFVQHPANGLEERYLDLVRASFTRRYDRLAMNGRWSWTAVAEYRREALALEEALLGGLHTACGQAPRSEELLSVGHTNGPTTPRGIYIWNGSVVYIVRHHKSKSLVDHDFHVVRCLPARLGRAMFLYLVYILPFLDMLRRQQIGSLGSGFGEPRGHVLFGRIGRAYKATTITIVLQNASRAVWGAAAGLAVYRQISVGIAEKHVREVVKPMNVYDDRSANADLNVALAWQSAHRPLQRGITYGLDGAYPWQLQPPLLRAYEWASTRWHEFLHQPSKAMPTPTYAEGRRPAAITKKRRADPDGMPPPKRQALSAVGTIDSQHDNAPLGGTQGSPGATQSPPRPHGKRISGLGLRQEADARPDDYIQYVPEYQVLLCTHCKAAVKPGQGIENHFRSQHRLKGSLLRQIVDHCSALDIRDPDSISCPIDGSRPIVGLRRFDGFSCSRCRFMARARDSMTRHFRLAGHEVREGEPQWTRECIQTWQGNTSARYWVVSIS